MSYNQVLGNSKIPYQGLWKRKVHLLTIKSSWNLNNPDNSGSFKESITGTFNFFECQRSQRLPYVKPTSKQDFSRQTHWIFHNLTFTEIVLHYLQKRSANTTLSKFIFRILTWGYYMVTSKSPVCLSVHLPSKDINGSLTHLSAYPQW